MAEPGALIGFAGQRVIRDTIKQELPEGFQTAEFALEHGLIDAIVERSQMRSVLAQLLALHAPADHIAYELGFFSLLAQSGEVGGAKRFWQDHLGLWLKRLCAAVIARDEPFYAPLFRDLSEVAASVNESLEPKGARS